nr:xylulose kinase-1 [Tanacetum cinerariifolium]
MKMEFWIMNTDHNLWKIIQNRNNKKSLGRDSKGGIIILPPVSFEEHVVVQRETKARTLLLQSLPEDHMVDFHHLDDAREIWLAVKARFGGNEESKKMRKTMLKQAFLEFIVSEEEGIHKGYDRALPPSWSQVALILKTRGGLEYLSFDDLYNKLRSLETDVKGGSSYGSRSTTVALTHSAFIGATSTNTKMVYSDQPSYSSSISYTPVPAGSIMEDVLHSFVAENEPTQQLAYEDLNRWINWRWKNWTSNGRWLCFHSGSISFKRRQAGRLTLTTRTLQDLIERRQDAIIVYSWDILQEKNKTKEAEQVYGLMAATESDFAVPAVQAYKNTVKTLEHQKDWYHSTQLALEEKVRILSTNLENTTNTLKYFETLYAQAKIEKQEWEIKFVESLARFDKWEESSKNLTKLLYSSMSTRTKLGLGFKEYIISDEVCDLFTPSVFDPEPENKEVNSLYERFVKAGNMHEVPSTITETFMPTSYQYDLTETQATFGSKSNTSSILTSKSNNFVSYDNSDKSSASETYDFASCVSSPKTNDSFSNVDDKPLPNKSHLIKDCHVYDTVDNVPSAVSKAASVRNLCNKSGTADRIPCKNNFVRTKKCFVCGSKSHLIKDCHVYDTVDNVPSAVSKAASVPAGSRNSSASTSAGKSIFAASRNRLASIYAGRPIPTASRKRPASIHAGKHILAGRINKPAPYPTGSSVPTSWTNPAARPFFGPSNLYFDNVHPHVNKDIGIVDSGCSRSMTGNKEKLDDFVQVKGITVTFRSGD